MQQAYKFFIFLSIIGLVMSLLYAYIHIKEKNKNPYFFLFRDDNLNSNKSALVPAKALLSQRVINKE